MSTVHQTPATANASTETPAPRGGALHGVLRALSKQYLAILLLVVVLVFAIFHPEILAPGNLTNTMVQSALTGIAAIGMTLLIIEGQLDLSVPGVMALSALAVATVLPVSTVGVAILAALVVGLVLGAVNGILVSVIRIPSFIATLGTQYLFLGIAFVLTKGGVVPVRSSNYSQLVNGRVGIIPVSFIVLVIVALLAYAVVQWTHFGRAIRATGSNERAAGLAGVPVRLLQIETFAIAGALFGLAGAFLAGRLSSAGGTMATGFELNAIAAVVVGGTALRGGRGTLLGTVIGAVLFSILTNALNLLGVSSYWQYIMTGVVLVAAVAVGARRAGAVVRGAS